MCNIDNFNCKTLNSNHKTMNYDCKDNKKSRTKVCLSII
jgi:hypothetical protein